MSTLYYSTTLVCISCGVCSIPFAMPENHHARTQQTGSWFWCPNGHKIHYTESENERLRRESEQLQQRLARQVAQTVSAQDARDREKRRHAATKGALTKTKKRVGKGVCPCCNRHFANVQRHMEGQHPEYIS